MKHYQKKGNDGRKRRWNWSDNYLYKGRNYELLICSGTKLNGLNNQGRRPNIVSLESNTHSVIGENGRPKWRLLNVESSERQNNVSLRFRLGLSYRDRIVGNTISQPI